MRSIITSLLLLLAGSLAALGQAGPQIQPGGANGQIQWPVGCTSGLVYAPATNTCVSTGGGGSLPTATQIGQAPVSNGAGTTYVIGPGTLSTTTGETLTQINSACSGLAVPTTLFINNVITDTITGNVSLDSHCWPIFGAQGELNITSSGGSFVVTLPNNVQGEPTTQHFAGSGGTTYSLTNQGSIAYWDWWGTHPGSFVWGVSAGTNDQAAVQACINAVSHGICRAAQMATYNVTGGLTINAKNNFALEGAPSSTGYQAQFLVGAGGSATPNQTQLISTSATETIVSITGTGTSTINWALWDGLRNMAVERSTTPTSAGASPAIGINIANTCGLQVENVYSADSARGFKLGLTPSCGSGYFKNSQALNGFNGFTYICDATNFCVGWYGDASNGFLSTQIHDASYSSNLGLNTNTVGMKIVGSWVEDLLVNGLATSGDTVGLWINGNSSVLGFHAADNHFLRLIVDSSQGKDIYVQNITGSANGSFIFHDIWTSANTSSASGIYCDTAFGLSFSQGIIEQSGGPAVTINNCQNISLSQLRIQSTAAQNGINISGGSKNVTLTGNTIFGSGATGIAVTGSTNISGAGNTLNGFTNGLTFDTTSINNNLTSMTYVGVTNQVVDSSTGKNNEWNSDTEHHFPSTISCGTGSCSGGSGLNGTVTYTTSATGGTSDNGKGVIMNCTAPCSYTLPATQPSTTWSVWLKSVGSTLATVVLGGADTYNGVASVPLLNSFKEVHISANTAVATDYQGDAPLTATSPIALTPSSNGFNVSCPTCSVGSGTSVTVNGGAALGTANLNDTTPAAGTNGINVKWQNSGTSVSAQVVGDGNSAHFLNGTGTYTTPSGGTSGALVPLATYTASSSTTINMFTRNATGQSGNLFQSDYDTYEVHIVNLTFSTAITIVFRFSTDGSTCDNSSIYDWQQLQGVGASASAAQTVSTTGINLSTAVNTLITNSGWNGVYTLFDPNSATLTKLFLGKSTFSDSSAGVEIRDTNGRYKTTTAAVGLCVLPSTGNFPAGSIHVYGVAH